MVEEFDNKRTSEAKWYILAGVRSFAIFSNNLLYRVSQNICNILLAWRKTEKWRNTLNCEPSSVPDTLWVQLTGFASIARSTVSESTVLCRLDQIWWTRFLKPGQNFFNHLLTQLIFTNPSARAGYDTRSIFKRSLTGLNSPRLVASPRLKNPVCPIIYP